MKKALILSTIFWSFLANAQYVTDESYIVYQEPYIARSYGNANWSYVTTPQRYSQPVYTNSYAQSQYSYNNQGMVPSPVYKRFYATARIGVGGTFGWDDKNIETKNPVGAIPSISIGAYLKPNIRLDGEFAYHTKARLYKGKETYLSGEGKYSQCDFGANIYYDFINQSSWRPFIGLGIWGVSSKVHSKVENQYHDTRDTSNSETNFAVSGTLGLAYKLNSQVSLEAMGRARYIFDADIYNLEALIGSRFSF